MKASTGNHSFAELLRLTKGLVYFRYFPATGSSFDHLECSITAIASRSMKELESFVASLRQTYKHISVRLYIDASGHHGRIQLTNRDEPNDLCSEHFDNGRAVEKELIDFASRHPGLLLELPDNLAANGFDPQKEKP